ncbi:hypothetical protein NHX12_002776 [Muraenolepis orangiensis]|uniref:Uncharacterized protein n=1 Tax=Muraenolepis orangiensis TaxID=630683 RepID=A0A9Q0IFS3_9TELE|nr:hypothetical protein NHX12_002776 [Muraenolepis orangiensis]
MNARSKSEGILMRINRFNIQIGARPRRGALAGRLYQSPDPSWPADNRLNSDDGALSSAQSIKSLPGPLNGALRIPTLRYFASLTSPMFY